MGRDLIRQVCPAGRRILTDLISLERFAMHQENQLVPFPERVNANFNVWMGQQKHTVNRFSDGKRRWLTMIRDHIAANLSTCRRNHGDD